MTPGIREDIMKIVVIAMFLVFKKCCFCVDLRLGSFIIAYLTLISRVSSLIFYSVQLSRTTSLILHHQEVEGDLSFHRLISIVSIMLLVFETLMCIALVVGLHKRLDQHLEMFYVGSLAFLVMEVMLSAAVITRYFAILKTMTWVVVAAELVAKLVFIYFLAVIRSYYYRMKAEAKDAEPLTPNIDKSFYARTRPTLISTKP